MNLLVLRLLIEKKIFFADETREPPKKTFHVTFDPRTLETEVHDDNMSVDIIDSTNPARIDPQNEIDSDEDKENFALTQGTNGGTNDDQIVALLRRDQELQLLASKEALERNRLREKVINLMTKMADKKA